MAWLKRNIFWVVGGVVALGLLGGATYYLYSSLQAEKQIDQQLAEKMATRDRLESANPHPGGGEVDNVAAAKKDADRVKEFLESKVEKEFKPIPVDPIKDTFEFKLLLDRTQAELEHDAESAGVGLPSKPYNFTFDAPKKSATLDPGALQPLAQQLMEVKSLCEILFTSKVHAVESLRRVPVSRVDTGTTDYLNTLKATTNAQTINTPYEVVFKGFSAEVASVVNGLAESDHCFVIRTFNTDVTTPTIISLAGPAGTATVLPNSASSQQDMMMRARYGNRYGAQGQSAGDARMAERYGNRYAPAPDTTAPQLTPPPPKAGPTNVIAEKPLRVALRIDAIRLKPAK